MRAGKPCSGLANTARCAADSTSRNGTGARPIGDAQKVQPSSAPAMRMFS
jgi:hypothetical protein